MSTHIHIVENTNLKQMAIIYEGDLIHNGDYLTGKQLYEMVKDGMLSGDIIEYHDTDLPLIDPLSIVYKD